MGTQKRMDRRRFITNQKYKNFEVYLEIKIDSLPMAAYYSLIRSGIAYQVELDETSQLHNRVWAIQ